MVIPMLSIRESLDKRVSVTEAGLYSCPLVTLISFFTFSDFLKVTNNLDGSLLKFFGALSKGIV